MTQGEPSANKGHRPRRLAWILRCCLVLAILYSTYASVFYGWYASFPGPNKDSATVVANIWSGVAVICVAALVASFVQRKQGPRTE